MKRDIALLMLFVFTTLAPAAFADVAQPSIFEQKRRAEEHERWLRAQNRPARGKLADVRVESITGGIELKFRLAGPGECEYTLRGPRSEDGPGPVAAQGSRAAEANYGYVLKETVLFMPAPEENVMHRYHLEALCRIRAIEQTSFGPKETEPLGVVRLTHTFNLLRESVYHVMPVRQ